MKRLLAAALAMLLVGSAGAAAALDATQRYSAMLERAKSDPAFADWQVLRFAYADRPGFNATSDGLRDLRVKMNAARSKGDWADAMAQAQAIVDKDFVDARAHLTLLTAYSEMKRPVDAEREHRIAIGLLKSMQTGTGLSTASPFTVITVGEEYDLMSARQRRVVRQSLAHEDGHSYDVLDTTAVGGEPVTFYFLIDRVLAAEAKALGLK